MTGTALSYARLVETELSHSDITDSVVYGISAWGLRLQHTSQANLVITPADEPKITVDSLEVAQFIYLMVHNEKFREIIDNLTSKLVLVLGRFSAERKQILEAVRDELRRHNYIPVLFDFEKPVSRDLTETISILAHIAKFIVADITEARSVPQELERIVPGLPSVPVQPLLNSGVSEYGMFEHFKRYPWVMELRRYRDAEDLLEEFGTRIIAPLESRLGSLKKEAR